MPSKAIATHTIFLIAVMGIFLLFTIISFWYWIGQTSVDASKASCAAKYMNYCERWIFEGKDPGDWNKVEPLGCEDPEIGIEKPESIEACKI
ncbi:MAG: hypothetical protein ISS48_00020 [Candidatus Aenigmarchaeota archaeon]|nr:hypothetical protein [Candidatus Aenigmarchaeota archaeon]